MREFLIGAATATALLGGSFAQAADLLQKAPPASVPAIIPAPVYSWTGFYAGGNIGAGWSSPTLAYNPGAISWGLNQAGFIGGGQIGFNYQIGQAVLGIESDADWTSLSRKSAVVGQPLQSKLDTPWMTTVAGRAGVANGNWLFFAKGGGAWVENDTTLYNAAGTVPRWSGSYATGGWLAGGGIEYAFGRNWSMKVEYDYIGLSNWTPSPGLIAGDSLKVSRDFQTAKVGFNYKF